MKIYEENGVVTFKFSPLSSLTIDGVSGEIIFGKRRVKFSEVQGFWKNYRVSGRKKVYFVVLLTSEFMDHITPDLDEYDADEVIGYLRKFLGDDKYAR